jgi:hypothetical protein
MNSEADAIDKAIANLMLNRRIQLADRVLTVALLIREADWRPLKAPWWHQKEACIIGADLDGNFFLSHCDGSVRYWDHKTQSDSVIAKSVRDFLQQLT